MTLYVSLIIPKYHELLFNLTLFKSVPHSLNDQERLNKTYALLHNMPIESYCTIKFLVQHLKR
jgi:hypothetical protein